MLACMSGIIHKFKYHQEDLYAREKCIRNIDIGGGQRNLNIVHRINDSV